LIKITFTDGAIREYEAGTSCKAIADSIAISLSKKCLLAKINGVLHDLSTTLQEDAEVQFLTDDMDDPAIYEVIRHSTAHLLAQAVKELYPDTQVVIGPVIDNGFYYDFSRSTPFKIDDLPVIENKMREIAARRYAVTRQNMSREEAIDKFTRLGEHYKVELIKSIPEGQNISVYSQGSFSDLCRGPHVPVTSFIKHFKLLKVSGSYWRGDSQNAPLQRIYGTAWLDKEQLDRYLYQLSESEKRDHRKIGKELGLFHQQDEAPGDVFWHPNGRALYLVIEDYLRKNLLRAGYQEVRTPQLLRKSLWETSGHWDKFGDNMFVLESEESYAIKPMNCPGHIQIFNCNLHSYRDLPLRMSEFGSCHRNEPSGALHGLMRVRAFTQDDAHIFCTKSQITSETVAFCNLLRKVYSDFGFKEIVVKLSDRPAKRAGDDKIWDEAEKSLEEAVVAAGYENFLLNKGEGAFYGPKLEFVLLDALQREWQCGTLQVDFVLPQRLGATYVNDRGERENPVILHRAILGSMERFIGILIEQYAGKFPLWLAPTQVAICGITNKQDAAVGALHEKLSGIGIRSLPDIDSETVNYKIRKYSNMKVPIVVVLGDRELRSGTVSIRKLDCVGSETVPEDQFISNLLAEAQIP
jgi:threonyl-tRNA synthetase